MLEGSEDKQQGPGSVPFCRVTTAPLLPSIEALGIPGLIAGEAVGAGLEFSLHLANCAPRAREEGRDSQNPGVSGSARTLRPLLPNIRGSPPEQGLPKDHKNAFWAVSTGAVV